MLQTKVRCNSSSMAVKRFRVSFESASNALSIDVSDVVSTVDSLGKASHGCPDLCIASASSSFKSAIFCSNCCCAASARAVEATMRSFMRSQRSATCASKSFWEEAESAADDLTDALSPSSLTSSSVMVLVIYSSSSRIHSHLIALVLAKSSSCALSSASCLNVLTFSFNSARSARMSTCLSNRSISNWDLKVVNCPCSDVGRSLVGDGLPLGVLTNPLGVRSIMGPSRSKPSCGRGVSFSSTSAAIGTGTDAEAGCSRPPAAAGITSRRKTRTLEGRFIDVRPAPAGNLSPGSVAPPTTASLLLKLS
mmetsp:Transcript_66123/g.123368  ORF Transcript_66123/g.123368 Transcript_66123/m.123368 type:complete len:308 (-) Transcript_66123:678-1601(-)